ncbi:MAG: branched-chain amino acid ABC transporter permease [Acidimicrobiia bacterium]
MSDAVQILVQGLTQGVVYALLAMGLAVVFRTSRVLNFAHGETLVVGVFVTYVLATNPLWPLPYPVAAVAGIVVGVGLGVAVYLVAVKGSAAVSGAVLAIMVAALLARSAGSWVWIAGAVVAAMSLVLLRGKLQEGLSGSIKWVLGTIAMATLLQEGLVTIIGATGEAVAVPGPFTGLGSFQVLGVVLAGDQLATAACALVLVIALDRLESRTRYGRAMKAVAYNSEAAALMGINVQRVVYGAFALAAGVAVVAGLLITPLVSPKPTDGPMYTVVALVAALLGGIDRVRSAALGGIVLGVTEVLLREGLSDIAGGRLLPLRNAFVYVILIMVLLLLPRGIFGGGRTERVA